MSNNTRWADVEISGSRLVWLIEDNREDAKRYKRLLERAGAVHVHIAEVRRHLDEYAGLAGDPTVGAVIVDQNLAEFSNVSYGGLDVANFLRAISSSLPVFILTNYYDSDLEENGGAVDLIINKEDVRTLGGVYVARILRRMGDYENAMSGQLLRYRALIDREIAGELTPDEQSELDALERDIDRPDVPILVAQEEKDRSAAALDDERLQGVREILAALKAIRPNLKEK